MRTILPAAFIILAAAPARAQSIEGASATQKAVQETGRVLRQAQSNARTEAARQIADRAADGGRLGQLAGEAREKLAATSGDDDRKLIGAVDRKLEPALRGAAPEGRAIIAQSAVAPPTRAPDPDTPKGGAPSKAPSGTGAADGKKGRAAGPQPSTIDILSEGAVYLDSAQALAIFTDDVVLDHPQFHMTSDKLEVYFVKGGDKKPALEKEGQGNKAAEPDAAPKAQPVDRPAPQAGDARLKQAIATGKKVVVRKLDENGEPQIGICRHLTYLGDSGDVILREMPQVQRGNNVIIARDSSTYMVMKQNGELKVHGPADTRIQQKSDAVGKPKASAPDAAPGTLTLTPKKTDKK
jgi:lipopolysaccharide export system protein LptA